MSTELLPRIEVHTHPKRGTEILTMELAGWTVVIDGQAVTVPHQPIAGKTLEGLRRCLREAYAMRNIAVAGGMGTWATIRPTLPRNVLDYIAGVLDSARRGVYRPGPFSGFDFYRCTRLAWERADMKVPFALVLAAMRAVLPPGMTLTAYGDAVSGDGIDALYAAALAAVRGRVQRIEFAQRGAA